MGEEAATFIDWGRLRNPVLSIPGLSIKDYACAYRDGAFYILFSAMFERDGDLGCHVMEVATRDWVTFSEPLLRLTGEEGGWRGVASPDVTRSGDTYYLTCNTWGDKPGQPNQLFYATSADLVHWSPLQPLAANLTRGDRSIDAAVAHAQGRVFLIWKDAQHLTRLAVAPSVEDEFRFVGDGQVRFETSHGAHTGRGHENYQFCLLDGRWRLLATYYAGGHLPHLYMIGGSGERDEDWLSWTAGRALQVFAEDWNTVDHANAAALYDWRAHDGHYYLLYAGNTERDTYRDAGPRGWGRGWNRLGLARSTDLARWHVPGQLA